VLVICPADTYEVCHVATNLPASQISVYNNQYGASLANDGRRRTSLDELSCSVSDVADHPWWRVDLGIPLTVTGVFFTNRDVEGTYTPGIFVLILQARA